MAFLKCYVTVLLISSVFAASHERTGENEIGRSIRTSEDLVTTVTQDCITGEESVMTCLRGKVLSYVDNLLGVRNEFEGRALSDAKMDQIIARRLKKYLNAHEFKVQLPKFLFEEAVLTFSPSRGLADFQIDFPKETKPDDGTLAEARGHLKKKLLLPLLLLLKLKIKALTPILLILVGIKAVKAFIMSKISLLLVIGFMVLQLFKKGGMSMPMAMPAAMVTDPPPVYGPPPTSATYGPPAPTPETSYGPWEANNGNNNGNGNGSGSPYARWDSHNIVYSAHQPEGTVKTAQQLQQGV